MCISATFARLDDVKVEYKPVIRSEIISAEAPTIIVKRAAPIIAQHDTSLPNVSEDILEKALNDRRFIQRQLKCATGEGPCDPIGRKIKGL